MTIPIANLYYLLAYAWDHLHEAAILNLETEDIAAPADLLARVLTSGTRHLLRRGLDRGYRSEEEVVYGLRAKLNLGATIKRGTLARAATVCEVDELTHDIPQNRIVKTTLQRVAMAEELDSKLRREARSLDRELDGIRVTADVPRTRRLVQLHRNNRFYSFLLDVCELVHDQTFALEGNAGKIKFRDFVRDEKAMRLMFQRFVHNFLKREQDVFDVGSPKVKWAELEGAADSLQFLPEMHTDIVLSSPDRVIVIDTKFTASAFQERYDKKKVKSDHIYQLHTYVQHVAAFVPQKTVEGILLYPVTTAPFRVMFSTLGHQLSVRSIDLRQDWKSIRAELLQLAA